MWRFALVAFVCFHNYAIEADQLLLVQAVWRHGDRTPLATFPKDPNRNRFPQGFGMLTDTGAKQQQSLGRWLRQKYVTNLKFLPSTYNSKYIYVRSSNFSRTINSAKNNLIGMYGLVPRIYVGSTTSDAILVPLSGCKRTAQFKEMIQRTSNFKDYAASQKSLFDRLTQLTGTSQTFARISVLDDTIFVEKLKGMSIPSAINDLFTQIRAAANKSYYMFWGYGKLFLNGTDQIGSRSLSNFQIRSLGGPFLKTILNNMRTKLAGTMTYRYMAYSAHDSTLMNLLSTFGFTYYNYDRNKIPSYASVLLFELWRRSSDQTPYVRIWYRHDARDYELSTKISGCTNGCTFQQFFNRCQPYYIKNVTAFCNTPPLGY